MLGKEKLNWGDRVDWIDRLFCCWNIVILEGFNVKMTLILQSFRLTDFSVFRTFLYIWSHLENNHTQDVEN